MDSVKKSSKGENAEASQPPNHVLKTSLGGEFRRKSHDHQVTLFPTIQNIHEYDSRKTEPRDMRVIESFMTEETIKVFGCADPGKLHEKSCFSVVLMGKDDTKEVVAAAFFKDVPMDDNIRMGGKRWNAESILKDVTPLNTLFFHLFVADSEYSQESLIQECITIVFQACDPVSHIILECPDLQYEGCYKFTPLVREVVFSPKAKMKKQIFLYEKDVLFPHLRIREGRESDLDDLSPLLSIDVKEMEDTFGRTYLSDLIAISERNAQSVVAEFGGEAVGIVAVTTDIDYTLLNNHFHLEPFHGLLKPYQKDQVRLDPKPSVLFDPTDQDMSLVDEYYGRSDEVIREEVEFFDPASSKSSSEELVVEDQERKSQKAKDRDLIVKFSLHDMFDREGSFRRISLHGEGKRKSVRKGTILTTYFPKTDQQASKIDLLKSPSQLEKLMTELDSAVEKLEEAGINVSLEDINSVFETAGEEIPQDSRQTIAKSADVIADCVYSYLHRTLIDTSLLPIEDLNEPSASTYYGIPNAVAIQLLTIHKRYDMRILDLIQGAFLTFPNREYCILTTPHSAKELPWMKYFVRVTPRKESLYPRSLHVIHRCSFTTKPVVRRAKTEDFCRTVPLIESLFEKDKIKMDLRHSICPNNNPLCLESYIAEVPHKGHNVVIGLAIMSHEMNSVFYQVNYDLDRYTYFDCHGPSDHAFVHHFILSPIFQAFSKTFSKEIMRLMKKDCFYHTVSQVNFIESVKSMVEHQSILNNLDDFIRLAPRKRINYKELSLKDTYDEDRQPPEQAQDFRFPLSVFHYAKKFTFDAKCSVLPRIVFIGASDTAIHCISKLISSAHLLFRNVTLISPNGVPGVQGSDEIRNLFFVRNGGIALSMRHDEEWHQRVGLKSLVNVVYGSVTRLFRELKIVIVNGCRVVPYDILVVTTGRQFIRPDCSHPEVINLNFRNYKLSTSSRFPPGGRGPARKKFHPKQLKRFTVKPKNMFLINSDIDATLALDFLRSYIPYVSTRHVVVHGLCLEAYCCIQALLKLGVSCDRLVVVTTPGDEMKWEMYHGYRDTQKLREVVSESLSALGIRVISGYRFRKWDMNKETEILNRVYFSSKTQSVKHMSISCLAYFAFTVRRVADEIATVMEEQFMHYNDGILINTAFETNDPNIYAAGPCAVYEKKLCAERYNHNYYSSEEVGQALAEILLKRVDPTQNKFQVNSADPGRSLLPPQFRDPQVRFAQLPGDWYYMHMSRPGWFPGCCEENCKCKECECATRVITGSTNKDEDPAQKYFMLRLNSFHRVEALECISKTYFSPSNLSALYGHHETILGKLLENLEKGQVTDLYVYFSQPWVAALCLDRWVEFRMELQDLYAEYDIGQDTKISNFIRHYLDNLDNSEALKVDENILRRIFDVSGLKTVVESKFLDFLKYNRSAVPMYARPDFVEQDYEERKSSTLYLPFVPDF